MDILQQQAFHNYFQLLGETVLEWYEDRPNNPQLKNVLKCVNEIGMFTHFMITENEILQQRIKQMREDRIELLKEVKRLQEYEL